MSKFSPLIFVIETKRQPPLWSVKVGHRYRAEFSGSDARGKAEAFARDAFGEFVLVVRPVPGREAKRLEREAAP